MRVSHALICLLFFSMALSAQKVKFNKGRATQKNYYTIVPYEELKGKLIIPIQIQGNSYRFLFDTGAPNLISHSLRDSIETKSLSSIHVKDSNNKRKPLNVVIIPLLEIGGVSFKNAPAIVNDVNSNFLFECLNIDGIIGSNLVRNSIVQIDSHKKHILFTDQNNKLNLSGMEYLDMALDGNQSSPYIWINLRGEGKAKEQVLFDSGAQGFYDLSNNSFKKLNEHQVFSYIDSAKGYKGIGLFGVAEPTTHYRVQVPSISLLGHDFTNVISISTAAIKSRLGAALFEYGRVTLNFKDKKFYFEPFDQKITLQEEVWSFSPTIKDGKLVVGLVWDDELSNRLSFGDRIIKMNDLETEAIDICDLLVNVSPLENDHELKIIIKDKSGEIKEFELENYYLKTNIK